MEPKVLPPAPDPAPQMSEDERIRLTSTMQLGPPRTFDPVGNQRDHRLVATVTELRPRVDELRELARRLRREIHSPMRKRIRLVLIAALFLVELVAVRLSLAQTGLEEPLPTLIAVGVVLGSFGLAVWASHQTSRVLRWLGVGLLALLVGGVALLRFDETSGSDEESMASRVGRGLVLSTAVLVPIVLAEWLLRQHVSNKRNEEQLAAVERELAEDEVDLQKTEDDIDARRADEDADRDQRARLDARLRLMGRNQA